jgi:hypothetical protein
VQEQHRAVLVGVVAENDAEPSFAHQPRQPLLAVAQRQGAEVLAAEFEEIESVQHCLADGATAVERVEDGDAIRPTHHGLAVERE